MWEVAFPSPKRRGKKATTRKKNAINLITLLTARSDSREEGMCACVRGSVWVVMGASSAYYTA